MVDSINVYELDAAIEKLKSYVASNYSTKSSSYYFSVLNGLKLYTAYDDRESADIIAGYYEMITHKPPYQRPDTSWLMIKARALLMLTDIINGNEPKCEYVYNREPYAGAFLPQLTSYREWLQEEGSSPETIRGKTVITLDFLRFLDGTGIASIGHISVECILSYLQKRQVNSSNGKRYAAYILRNFLTCPMIRDGLVFDPFPLLCGFRLKKNDRLKSCYTTAELKMVMDAVDRTSNWGKTIYAMMLLACVYGLRVSDIRELYLSSIHWQKRTISLYQKKTKRYVELPLTEETMLALLDYLRNVRPSSPDPHVFIRYLHPHVPYSEKDNFGSKVTAYFRKAGVNTDNKHHGLHSMRFSLATDLLSDDVPINEIAAILGHTTIKSTKQYIWSDLKHLKAAALEVPAYDQ